MISRRRERTTGEGSLRLERFLSKHLDGEQVLRNTKQRRRVSEVFVTITAHHRREEDVWVNDRALMTQELKIRLKNPKTQRWPRGRRPRHRHQHCRKCALRSHS